jgi:hypothetical protein
MSIQVITVTGNISLTTSDSGNVYQLNVPSTNSTINLPSPTNGFNATFIGNNNSSYTYSFSTPRGLIIQSTAIGINSPITISNVNPTITVSGNIGREYFVNSDGTNYTIFEINLNPTGITPGTYGSSTQVPQITFDETGKVIGASNIPIAFPSSSINVTSTDLTMSGSTGTNITNATLVPTGVNAGTYGSSTDIPQITVDSKGRITSASNVSIPSNSISVTGSDLTMSGSTGTDITNATLVDTGVTVGTYGSGATIPQITIDSKGRITSATSVGVAGSISVTGGDLTMSGTTGSDITNATLTNTGVTAGTYGGGATIPQITIDSKGRITSATSVGVAGSISVTGSDLTMSGTTGSTITNATLTNTGVTAGTYGNGATIPQITVDSKGRITKVTSVGVAGSISVTGGDLTMSGTTGTAITNATLTNTGVTPGIYNNSNTQITPFTVDSKGRIMGVSSPITITPAWSSITNKPTTLAGYGITDAAPINNPRFTGTVSIPSGSFLAINTTTPTFPLQVNANVLFGIPPAGTYYSIAPLNLSNNGSGIKSQLNLINGYGGVGTGSAIDFYTYTDQSSSSGPGGRIAIIDDGKFSGNIQFFTKDGAVASGAITPKLTIIGATGFSGFGTASPSERVDVNGNIQLSGALKCNLITTLTGTTAGSVKWSQYMQGQFKAFAAQFLSYENNTTTNQTITFPTPFVNTPVIVTNTTGLTISVTTTTLTITAPNNTTVYNGIVKVEGF